MTNLLFRGFNKDEMLEIIDDGVVPHFSKKEFADLVPNKYFVNENGVVTNPDTLKIKLPKSYKVIIETNYIKVGDRYLISEQKPSVQDNFFVGSYKQIKLYLINKSLGKYKNEIQNRSDSWNHNIRLRILSKLQELKLNLGDK